MLNRLFRYEEDAGNNGGGDGGQGDGQGGLPASWDDALKTLPEGLQTLYNDHVKQFNTNEANIRRERNELRAQIGDLQKQVEKGSDAAKALDEFQSKLDQAEQRAAFYEDATKPETGCQNPKLAYLAATADGLIDQRGRVNWDALKQAYPEMFKTATPPGNAGNGSNQGGTPGKSMNSFIRAAAGRQP